IPSPYFSYPCLVPFVSLAYPRFLSTAILKRILFELLRPPMSSLFPYTTLFRSSPTRPPRPTGPRATPRRAWPGCSPPTTTTRPRSEEHTSELQSRFDLVCRLLLEKKNSTALRIYGERGKAGKRKVDTCDVLGVI